MGHSVVWLRSRIFFNENNVLTSNSIPRKVGVVFDTLEEPSELLKVRTRNVVAILFRGSWSSTSSLFLLKPEVRCTKWIELAIYTFSLFFFLSLSSKIVFGY